VTLMTELMDGLSKDLESRELEKLRAVFPQCFTEGRLDIDKLLNLCGQYIDDDFEKYEFKWKGKAECLKLAQRRSPATLRPCPEESVDFESSKNLYIEGDNLEVLKLLQASYYRQVKMIYIDPPYNTGHDFIYEDDFKDSLARYKEVTSQTSKSNPESMGRFHTNWLNMMYPRLRLAAGLLRDDGVIFISIDDHEVHNLRKLCDEVFGEEHFIEQIVWQKRTSPDARKIISAGHEYVLAYAKNISRMEEALKLLPLSDNDASGFKNPDNDPRGPWVSSDFTAQGYRPNQVYKITTPGGAEYSPASGRCWKNVESVFRQQVAEGRMWFGADGKGVPRRKTYLAERPGKNLWTWWPNKEVGHTQEATQELKDIFSDEAGVFDFPKPTRLIKRMVQTATKSSGHDIVFDFFSGSATTAQAVMQVNAEDGGNRRFIMIQLPELTKSDKFKNICEIGKERIRRAGQKIKKELAEAEPKLDFDGPAQPEPDIGFKVFKLDSSNLEIWDPSPVKDEQLSLLEERLNRMTDRAKPGRSALDLVYEIMLKQGLPLTESVRVLDIEGYSVYSIREDSLLLICLEKDLSTEAVKQMAALAPGRIIFGQGCFGDMTAMSNAKLSLKDAGIDFKFV